MYWLAKNEFQDRVRLLLRNGRYPSAHALGYVNGRLSQRQLNWWIEATDEWLAKDPTHTLGVPYVVE